MASKYVTFALCTAFIGINISRSICHQAAIEIALQLWGVYFCNFLIPILNNGTLIFRSYLEEMLM